MKLIKSPFAFFAENVWSVSLNIGACANDQRQNNQEGLKIEQNAHYKILIYNDKSPTIESAEFWY